MSDSENPNGRSVEVAIGDAKPYRSPVVVSDQPKKSVMKPLLAWAAVAGALLCGFLVYAYARSSAKEDLNTYVKSFGDDRRGPLQDEPWERGGDDLGDLSAESPTVQP